MNPVEVAVEVGLVAVVTGMVAAAGLVPDAVVPNGAVVTGVNVGAVPLVVLRMKYT